MKATVRSAAASRRVRPVAVLGIAVALTVGAAALAADVMPDPLAWAPHPEHPGVSWVWVTAVGSVSFDAPFGEVSRVDPEGWLRIEERRATETRWIVALPQVAADRPAGAGGADVEGSGARIRYFVDGHEAAWDDAARAWLAGLVVSDAALPDALRALEGGGSGGGRGNVSTSDAAWVSVVQLDPTVLESFGSDHLRWTLFGLGGPHPFDPSRPRRERGPFGLATEGTATLFVAHQLSAHGLVAPGELEAFLVELAALARRADGEEAPASGK
jgi:hypothetical protein